MTSFSKTPLLDTIRTPDDLRKLKVEQVRQVADELRQETIDAVSGNCDEDHGGGAVKFRRLYKQFQSLGRIPNGRDERANV